MARIANRTLPFSNADVTLGAERSTNGPLGLKELRALRFEANLALPPHAAELRDAGRVLGAPTQRDALRLPALSDLDAAASVALAEGLAHQDLGSIDAAPEHLAALRSMQGVLRDVVAAAQLNRGHRSMRI